MANEKLKQWVKKKRKEGVSDERIKESLKETGHDPSIVDELDDPFDEDRSDSDTSISEDDFKFVDDEDEKDEEKDTTEDETDEAFETEKSQVKKTEEKVKDSSKNSSFKPSVPKLPKKKIGILAGILLIIAGGFAVYNFLPENVGNVNPIPSDSESESNSGLASLDAQHPGCPDSGVRVESVSASEGTTTADVLVTREETMVVLIVKQGGENIGFNSKSVLGEDQISVNAVGDEVELRPLGCQEKFSRRSY